MKLSIASLALLLFLICGQPSPVSAQTFSVDWYKVAGGGGTSTGGVFAASGTIGQHDAADVMTSGLFSLAGGFWSSVSVVPTPGPNLVISYSGSDIVISWPDTGSYTLQQNLDVAAAGWVASAYSITTLNGTNRITIPSPAGQLFFRLKQ